MGRRRTNTKAPFTPHQFSGLKGRATILRECLSDAAAITDLTHDDVLSLTVPTADDRHVLRWAPYIGDRDTNSDVVAVAIPRGSWDWPVAARCEVVGLCLTANRVGDMRPPLMPREPGLPIDVDPVLLERVRAWLKVELEIARDFYFVGKLLDWFQNNCTTAEQVRYIWPPILTLCRDVIGLTDVAERIAPFKAPSALPPMTPALKAAAVRLGGVVSAAYLVPAPAERPTPAVVLSLNDDVPFTDPAFGYCLGR